MLHSLAFQTNLYPGLLLPMLPDSHRHIDLDIPFFLLILRENFPDLPYILNLIVGECLKNHSFKYR